MPHSSYVRPVNDNPLTPSEKAELLKQYFSYYESIAQDEPDKLNIKLERAAATEILDEIGGLLLERSRQLANQPGPVKEFLDATALPEFLRQRLPNEFRAFCLILNSLKQWVSAESAATDRYLLGGTARNQCRRIAEHCLVTGELLDQSSMELHHSVRDGRPPIPLSKPGHDQIESSSKISDDPTTKTLRSIKKESHRSWVMLRRGCLSLLEIEQDESTPAVLSSSRTFARKAQTATGLAYQELIDWLDQRDLGH